MRNPFPLSASLRMALAAWLVYLVSYTFLAGNDGHLFVPGHGAAVFAYSETYKAIFWKSHGISTNPLDRACPFWMFSNFLMVSSPLLLLWRRRTNSNALSWVLSVSALSPVLAFFSIEDPLQFLDKGFYFWWLSFGMISAAFFLAQQSSAVTLRKFQFGVDTLTAVTVAAGLLLGLNLQHYRYCMTAFGKQTFEPAWIIPCQVLASLLALALFFDLWEARHRRAEAAAK